MTMSTKALIVFAVGAIITASAFWLSLPQEFKTCPMEGGPQMSMKNDYFKDKRNFAQERNMMPHHHAGGVGFLLITGGAIYLAHRKEGGKK